MCQKKYCTCRRKRPLRSVSKWVYPAYISGDSGFHCNTKCAKTSQNKLFGLTSPFCVSGQWRDPQGRVYEQGLSLWVLPLWGESSFPNLFCPSISSSIAENRNLLCSDFCHEEPWWLTSLPQWAFLWPYLSLFFPSLRSVVSSSPISSARSASPWTLISSATPVTWAECAPHTDQCCAAVGVFEKEAGLIMLSFSAFLPPSFFKMKLLILRHFHWFTFILCFDSDQFLLSHELPAVLLVLLLYHSYKGTGKKTTAFFFFFYPNVATVCCRSTREFA